MLNFKKEQLNIIFIISISITTLALLIVICIPIMLKTKKENDFSGKSLPNLENTNLWAKFPGDLDTSLTHKYSIFEYKENEEKNSYNYTIKENFSIIEEVSYSNFKLNESENQIFFDTNRTYKYIINKSQEKDPQINSISMGMFEALESLTNPSQFKIGINTIHYLIKKILINPDLFTRKLFTYKIYNEIIINETLLNETILKNISDEKYEKIMSEENIYSEYSFKRINGFYQWILILGEKEKIENSSWLKYLFELTDEEIYFIIGENSYLNERYKQYNTKLSEIFNCKEKSKCGIELLYLQLINGNVIETLFPEIKSFKSLYEIIEKNNYPFDKSPEMNNYFEEEYKKKLKAEEQIYIDYSPSIEQLNNLIDNLSEKCLLSSNNSINFLYYNKTNDLDRAIEVFNVSLKVMNFLSDYFYDYLSEIFLYPKIQSSLYSKLSEESNINIDPLSKTYSTIIQTKVSEIYEFFNQIGGLYDYMVACLVFDKLKEKFKFEEKDEICPLFFQTILDDGGKVLKICENPLLGFDSEISIIKWLQPYSCMFGNETKCNISLINYLKKNIYISVKEIRDIYSEEYLGGLINSAEKNIDLIYQCEEKCGNEHFLKLQLWFGNITQNAPNPLKKTDTLQDWLPDIFQFPIEIPYYQKIYNDSESYEEKDIDYIIELMQKGKDLLDDKNSNALLYKLNLEKEFTLYINGLNLNNEKKSLFKLIDFLINSFVFKDSLFTNYKSKKNLLQGNKEEDINWIKYISSGNYFDNFIPKYIETTGFDFGINLETKKQSDKPFDNYGIIINNNNDFVRKIISMNNYSTLNIYKKEYDFMKNKTYNIFSPIFNFETLLGIRAFSDGFQYSHNLEVIYYYDIISSRPYRFIYKTSVDYKNKIECKRYELDVEELDVGINEYFDNIIHKPMITQKLNKPFMISIKLKEGEEEKKNIENYICVDPISNMVVDSHINLIYSIYSRNYSYINKKIENDKSYPIFTYERIYQVSPDSYEKQFPGVTDFYTFKLVFIIIGIVVIIIFGTITVISFYLLKKKLKEEPSKKMEPSQFQENLIQEDKQISEINRFSEE